MIAKYVDHLINFDPIDSSAFSNLRLKVVISDMTGLLDHWHFSTLSPPPPPPTAILPSTSPLYISFIVQQRVIKKYFQDVCYNLRLISVCSL